MQNGVSTVHCDGDVEVVVRVSECRTCFFSSCVCLCVLSACKFFVEVISTSSGIQWACL